MKLQAIWKRVIVKVKAKKQETSFWIVLPEAQKNQMPQTGEIIQIWDNSDWIELKTWDTIFFREFSPTKVEIEWEEFLILEIKDVLAKLA